MGHLRLGEPGTRIEVGTAGTDAQVTRAVEIVTEARKELYRLLAED